MKAGLLLLVASTVFAAPLEDISPRAEAVPFPIHELEAYYNAAYSVKPTEDDAISKRQYARDTFNQLTDGTPCRAVTLIWARGTTQAGNVGEPRSEGPTFFNALAARVGASNLAVQGVNYPANVIGFLQGGDPAGSTTMANLVSQAASKCPNTKIVLSGYSQGGQLVHNAAGKLSTALTNKISAVLIFGDPFRDQAVGKIPASKVRIICHSGDNICEGGIIITDQHRNYENDAASAATFVASLVR